MVATKGWLWGGQKEGPKPQGVELRGEKPLPQAMLWVRLLELLEELFLVEPWRLDLTLRDESCR